MQLITKYGETLNKERPLDGHPDPYFKRDNFISLNGKWDFLVNKSKNLPNEYNETIIVPFSMETSLSGIGRRCAKDDYLHYRKEVHIPSEFIGGCALLRFMAVDQECDVYIDGKLMTHHEGGYSSFRILLEKLKEKIVIEVVVHDDTDSSKYARGKQMNSNKGIWYTPTSGIHQEVYLEFIRTQNYIDSCRITPDFDNKKIHFNCKIIGKIEKIKIELSYKGKVVGETYLDKSLNGVIDVKDDFYPWSNIEPNLYDVLISSKEDSIHSVAAIRKISYETINDRKYLLLNDEPIFLNGLLDQGYYPDGGLTPPSVEAMKDDIQLAKNLGFNVLRKHIKIEPRRWYYLCDSLGMIVMQDLVNGGAKYSQLLINLAPFLPLKVSDKNPILGRINDESKNQFKIELKETINELYNIPSILVWTLFNEGWGQFNTKECLSLLQSEDSTRLIDATSGWYDKKLGDFRSRHIYFRPVHIRNDKKRLLSLTEFGGYSMYVKGHSYSEKAFGYKKYKDSESLQKGLTHLYEKEIKRTIKKDSLCIAIYTQLTDVEEEVNGLITYDRKVLKVDSEEFKRINEAIYSEYKNKYSKEKNDEKR